VEDERHLGADARRDLQGGSLQLERGWPRAFRELLKPAEKKKKVAASKKGNSFSRSLETTSDDLWGVGERVWAGIELFSQEKKEGNSLAYQGKKKGFRSQELRVRKFGEGESLGLGGKKRLVGGS